MGFKKSGVGYHKKQAKVLGRVIKSIETDFVKARVYHEAADNWRLAKKPKRAVENYEKAERFYRKAAYDAEGEGIYRNYSFYSSEAAKVHKTAERLKKVISGEWRRGLEGRTTIFILAIIGGVSLGVSSLTATGNTVSNLTQTTSGLLGIIFFIVGLVGLVFNLKKK